MPAVGRGDARPDVVTHPLESCRLLGAREGVEADLQPAAEAVRDLERLVYRVFRGHEPVLPELGTLQSIVAVQLEHRAAAGDEVRAVDLDLVVVLRARGRRREKQEAGSRRWDRAAEERSCGREHVGRTERSVEPWEMQMLGS